MQTKQQGLTVCNGDEYPDHAFPALNPKQVKVSASTWCCAADLLLGCRKPAGAEPSVSARSLPLRAAPPAGQTVRCRACPPQLLQDKIRQQYRVRLILDNLPITTYDLELDPESGTPA